MKKGIFWCVDADTPHPGLIVVSVNCTADGEPAQAVVFSSKSGTNYNHKTEWERLDKRIKGRHRYNYYPRGRVEIKNGKATIFLHPDLNRENILQMILQAFGLQNAASGLLP